MSETLSEYIERKLKEAREAGLHRRMREVARLDGAQVEIAGKTCISFASNDYLGLSRHPKVIAAAGKALEKYGAGAGSSRLVIGNLSVHQELERRIASFKKRQAARIYATGYLANIGTVCALVGPGDAIISDSKNHASIIDACRLSGAKILLYNHNDMNSLREKLIEAQSFNNKLVIAESIFSIDGDIAPVGDVAGLAKEFGAWSMIDEAHATGIIGENGRGAEEHFNCTGEVDIVMGTLSKAVGAQGGFIAGDPELVELLTNTSRPLIYSTGLAPAAAAAATESLKIMESQPELREKLFENVTQINKMLADLGLRETPSETPIIPVVIGKEQDAVKAFEKLFDKGFIVPVMRYPTVPRGKATLRLSASALHTPGQLTQLHHALTELQQN